MADVQLEKGYYRIANWLDEALTFAPFSLPQLKAVRCILRLTFGWGRKTVRVAVSEVAERCNLTYSGAFRRAFAELVREGVIIEVEPPRGRRPALYMVHKNHEDWGRFSVAPRTLERLFRVRLPSDDSRILDDEKLSVDRPSEGTQTQANETEFDRPIDSPPEGTQAEKLDRPLGGHITESLSALQEGTQESRNSNNGETYEVPKDSTTERHLTATATAAAAANGSEGRHETAKNYAVQLSTAANAAIAVRWNRPMTLVQYSTGLDLAEELLALSVPVEFARQTIAAACERSKLPQPPSSLRWFRGAVMDAVRDQEQRRLNAADPAVSSGPRGSNGLAPIGAMPILANLTGEADRVRAEEAEHTAYATARHEAAMAWGKDPANAAEYHRIVAAETGVWGPEQLKLRTIQRTRDVNVVLACAERCGFPDKATWLASRRNRSPPAA